MANSISLSSDMEGLYLIESNGAISFSCDLTGNGIVISLDSSGNLVAGKASTPPTGSGFIRSVTNAQWDLSYHKGNKTLYVIGVVDILNDLTEGDGNSLDGQSVQVYRNGDSIGVELV